MRRTLVAAVALAPLCLAMRPQLARADDTISGGTSTAVSTASAGDVTIDSGGSITVGNTTPAVTINSSNSLTNEGSISISGIDDATGVLIKGGYSGSVSNIGYITLSDSYTTTTNSDGYTEEPYVEGVGRYGIRLTGTSAFTGDIGNSGEITIGGNDSYGISIEAPLIGSLTNSGTISITGNNSVGIYSTAAISGGVQSTGEISATGAGSSAIKLEGSVGGAVSIYSDVYATAYATVTRPTETSTLTSVQSTASQVEQSGAAVVIGGSVAGGIFIGAPPVGTTTDSTADLDGDGIEDGYEGTGTITNYGSAAGLLIGSSGNNITIGEFGTDESATANNAFGLIVRGEINGFGTYDGVSATALQIGTGDGEVTIDGGIRIAGSINAESYEADSTAIHIMDGATVPEILNEDYIESTVLRSTLSTTEIAASAYGIEIEAGANVSSLVNIGTIQASVEGDNKSAYAVVDKSGTLSSILNEGIISAAISPTATGDATTGSTVALDLSANTTGVTLIQQVNPNPIAIETSTTTSTSGVVSTTAAITTTTTSTTSTATTTTTVTTTSAGVTTTTTTTTPTYPEIIGDVLLGNGNNNVELLGGEMLGALSMGSGTDTLTIDGAYYAGSLSYSGSALALTVTNGTLLNENAATLKLSSLTVGSGGLLYAAIDPTNSASTLYQVSGTATFASGSELGIYLKSPLYTETSYTIVSASSLVNNSTGSVVLAEVPYLLVGTATTDTSAGTITVDLRRRTAAEMGLNPGQSAALNAVYDSLPNDSTIESAFLTSYTRSSFLGLYNQMLPDYSGGTFQLAEAASDAVSRATASVNDIQNPSGVHGLWAQEVAFGVQRPAANAAGYQGAGFGFVAGAETGGSGFGAFGVTAAFLSGEVEDPSLPGDDSSSFSEGEFGGYWQGQFGGFRADGRLAVGYVKYADHRELYEADSSGTVELDRSAKGSSSGFSSTGHFGLGYETGQFGWFYFRPQAKFDYFRLYQGGYTEHGGGDGFDLALNSRTGQQYSASASMVTGMKFGQSFQWRPELELGYRDVFSGDAGATTARFAADTEYFTMQAAKIVGGGPTARLNVKADTDFYELNLSTGAEYRDRYTEADIKFSVKVLF